MENIYGIRRTYVLSEEDACILSALLQSASGQCSFSDNPALATALSEVSLKFVQGMYALNRISFLGKEGTVSAEEAEQMILGYPVGAQERDED